MGNFGQKRKTWNDLQSGDVGGGAAVIHSWDSCTYNSYRASCVGSTCWKFTVDFTSHTLQVDLFIGLKWSNYSWNHVSSLQRTPSLSRHSNRPPSVADSMAEYFDASEVIVCETSSEAEASDESGLSDITTTTTSEPEEGHCECLPSNKSRLHDFLCHNKG